MRFTLVLLFLASFFVHSSHAATSASGTKVFLPVVAHNYPLKTVFGIEMSNLSPNTGLDLALTSGTRWVRRNALLWSVVEPVEGAGYSWDNPSIQQLEGEMLNASKHKLDLILIVRGSPRWATAPYQSDCSPINEAKYAAFGQFLKALVERYSKPPYNVRYWEIGNEPDAPLYPYDYVYGCWGVESDAYFGGRAYGTMLRTVYPLMKQANPSITVLNGGLLLDRPYEESVASSLMGRFFEGMLVAGAGNSFDMLSFHTYNFYNEGPQPFGPEVDWRVAYLQNLLARYQVAPKPLLRSETALLCVVVTTECRWAQADYVARSFVQSMRDKLVGNIWYVYDNDSYHNTALIEPDDVFVPRPAYFAYRHTARMLSGAVYQTTLANAPANVSAHLFRKGSNVILVYWTDVAEGVPFGVGLLPWAKTTCTSRDGGNVPCVMNAQHTLPLTAQRSPAFVVIEGM
jgi:hypothetical protein